MPLVNKCPRPRPPPLNLTQQRLEVWAIVIDCVAAQMFASGHPADKSVPLLRSTPAGHLAVLQTNREVSES